MAAVKIVGKKTSEPSIIPEGKITKLIAEIYNKEANTERKHISENIKNIMETLDNFPSKPSLSLDPEELEAKTKSYNLESTAIRKDFRKRYAEIKKIENELLALEKPKSDEITKVELELSKLSEGDPGLKKKKAELKSLKEERRKLGEDHRKKLDHLKAPLTKSETKIFEMYDAKKALGKGNVRIGNNVPHIISSFACQALHGIILNGLNHLKETKLKTLHNKHVFMYIDETELYPFYSGIKMVKKFRQMARQELENDESNFKYAKVRASHLKSKKEKTEAKSSKPVKSQPPKPQLHSISYSCPEVNSKFEGCVKKLWDNIKPADYQISAETKTSLAYFTHEFITVLLQATKDLVDFDQMLTFKAKHFCSLVKSVSRLHSIDMDGFLKLAIAKTDKKIKENGEDDKAKA